MKTYGKFFHINFKCDMFYELVCNMRLNISLDALSYKYEVINNINTPTFMYEAIHSRMHIQNTQ